MDEFEELARILRAEFIARLRIRIIVFITEEWGIVL